MSSARARWLRAVKSPEFPAELRSVRATLICLADLMAADGTLSELRDRMADVAGLPPRTLDRHLHRAVARGWLLHEVHATKGRRSRYAAAVEGERCAPIVARFDGPSGGVKRATFSWALDPRIARHLMAHSIEDGERSEHGALDSTRLRRPDHDGSRDTSPCEPEEQQRSDGPRAGLRLITADGQPVAERAAS